MKFTNELRISISQKKYYELITEEELESPSMPHSIYMGSDDKYSYYKCGHRRVKINKVY